MIINFPTGFYRTVLPQMPSDSTSVTFTISNSIPPRTELLFPQIPSGIEARQRLPELSFDRDSVGDLIFTISSASRTEIDNNARLLDIGQILEFTDTVPAEVDQMLVTSLTEVRHDTSKFDYASMGLDADDVLVLEMAANEKLLELQSQLNVAKTNRSNSEQIISEQQKLINDLDRNIKALEVITADITAVDDDILEVVAKLKIKRKEALVLRDAARVVANASANEAVELADELRTMATVVK